MAAQLQVRAGLAAELRRLVRDAQEWPVRDRRRFRNLLLDAVTSDAMPMAELLLLAHDDGLLRALPDRSATRASWDAATARLASDLQTRRFVEPSSARFVAEAWAVALGPDVAPSAVVALPRPTVAPRQPMRSSAQVAAAAAASRAAASTSAVGSAASMRAYRRSNLMFLGVAAVFTIGGILAFQQTGRIAQRTPVATPMPVPDAPPSAQRTSPPRTAGRFDVQPSDAPRPVSIASSAARADTAPPAASAESPVTGSVPHPPIVIASAPVRLTDDIVLNTGRVFEGRVLSVRQQSVVVKDEDTGLDFEIATSDLDRIVTRDGRVMRFGDDNVPLLGDEDDLTAMSHGGRYRVRYAARWGTERVACRELARRFAPGEAMVVRHMRGAPMMKLEFVRGPGYNAAVRADGLFESGSSTSAARGPDSSFVSSRISGRISRSGVLQGVARLTAVQGDGTTLCDLALTMQGEREP